MCDNLEYCGCLLVTFRIAWFFVFWRLLLASLFTRDVIHRCFILDAAHRNEKPVAARRRTRRYFQFEGTTPAFKCSCANYLRKIHMTKFAKLFVISALLVGFTVACSQPAEEAPAVEVTEEAVEAAEEVEEAAEEAAEEAEEAAEEVAEEAEEAAEEVAEEAEEAAEEAAE